MILSLASIVVADGMNFGLRFFVHQDSSEFSVRASSVMQP